MPLAGPAEVQTNRRLLVTYALHSGMDVKAYAEGVGRDKERVTVQREVMAARVAEAVFNGEHGGDLAPHYMKAASFRSEEELRNLVRAAGLHTEGASGAIYYPRSALIASLIAPLDPWLGELTTFGAAFVALHAAKVD